MQILQSLFHLREASATIGGFINNLYFLARESFIIQLTIIQC
jgi:hypothetical protein